MRKELSVLIICFLRTSHIESQLNVIAAYGIKSVYVSIDGPRNSKDIDRQNDLLAIFSESCNKYNLNLTINRFSNNLGLSQSIISSIDWFFANVDFGIILEDDLLISENFLKFVEESKSLLDRHDDLLIISGNQFRKEPLNLQWSHYPLIWGWASNARKWRTIRKLAKLRKLPNLSNFNLKTWLFWSSGILRLKWKLLNSWALPLAANMKALDFLTYLPTVNLVSHEGFDDVAVHSNIKSIDLKISLSRDSSLHSTLISNTEIHSEAKMNDIWFEKNFYKIGNRVLLSPIKLFLQIFISFFRHR